MLNDASGFQHVYLCTGYTDLRKGIDGLISIVTGTFGLDPTEAGSIFLFCGRRNDRMKVLLYEGDGWLLCYKRFTDGKLQSVVGGVYPKALVTFAFVKLIVPEFSVMLLPIFTPPKVQALAVGSVYLVSVVGGV